MPRPFPYAPRAVWLLAASAMCAAACDADYRTCPAVPASTKTALPSKLSETGLYDDVVSRVLSADVSPYHPQFALWSDGADKRRFIQLPPDATIDTRDMDDWIFPEGTKLWKEFWLAGTPVETRLLQKIGPSDTDWSAAAYIWNEAGDDADASWDGQNDARGTSHDVPAASQCMGCHAGRRSRVLGFSAIQLSYAASDDTWDVTKLAQRGRLSRPPERAFELPGDASDRAALGYLHANCSHCHNRARPDASGPRCYDPQNGIDFRLLVDALSSVAATPAVRSAVRQNSRRKQMLERMSSRDSDEQMPPLATELVDRDAVGLLRAWLKRF